MLVRDGKYAVVYSFGFGAGWATWAHDGTYEPLGLATNAELAAAVLGEIDETPQQVADRLFPECYGGGIEDLVVSWVPIGERFYLTEYDGREDLHTSAADPFWN